MADNDLKVSRMPTVVERGAGLLKYSRKKLQEKITQFSHEKSILFIHSEKFEKHYSFCSGFFVMGRGKKVVIWSHFVSLKAEKCRKIQRNHTKKREKNLAGFVYFFYQLRRMVPFITFPALENCWGKQKY